MALRAGNSKQYNGYVVSWQMPAEVFAPISYRETSSFARARRSMNEWITGTMKIATIPPANPLLYKFMVHWLFLMEPCMALLKEKMLN